MGKENYSLEVKMIIKEQEIMRTEIRDIHKYIDVNPVNFEVDNIDILYFMICLDPESTFYGTGNGVFVYNNEQVYLFRYNIHTPHSKGPHISNTMTSVDQLILKDRHDITMLETKETEFGFKAFWDHTPMECLNQEEKSLRQLMRSIQSYCRKENLCAKLRKTDKIHEKWKSERRKHEDNKRK